MTLPSHEFLAAYWSEPEVAINLVVFMNLAGALALGLLVGYERSYHGRAAGMRTYGLVCLASAGLTVVAGYPAYWFGGHNTAVAVADPTRVIQGIVTGVGFLGAGVIMKEGLNISGLTTAASIWATSAIGVLVGVGFYAAAILLAALSAALMMWLSRLENWLPSRPALALSLRFRPGFWPDESALGAQFREWGYEIARGSFAVEYRSNDCEWRFVAISVDKTQGVSVTALAARLGALEEMQSLQISHARN